MTPKHLKAGGHRLDAVRDIDNQPLAQVPDRVRADLDAPRACSPAEQERDDGWRPGLRSGWRRAQAFGSARAPR